MRALGRHHVTLRMGYGDAPDAEVSGPFDFEHTPWGASASDEASAWFTASRGTAADRRCGRYRSPCDRA
jgi:hypothetical protein